MNIEYENNETATILLERYDALIELERDIDNFKERMFKDNNCEITKEEAEEILNAFKPFYIHIFGEEKKIKIID